VEDFILGKSDYAAGTCFEQASNNDVPINSTKNFTNLNGFCIGIPLL